MAGWTNAEEVAILDWYFRGQTKTPPSTLYVALLTAEPSDTGTYTEVSYTGYTREAITSAQWNAASGADPSVITNSVQITFALCSQNTGQTATYFMLANAQTPNTGTMMFSGQITQPPGGLALNDGVQPQFDPGALRAQLGG